MKLVVLLFLLLIAYVDLRRQNDSNDNDNMYELDELLSNYNHHKSHSNKEYLQDLSDDNQKSSSSFQREKKYSSRKKVLEDVDTGDEPEKPSRRIHSSKANNQSELSDTINRATQKTKTTTQSYAEEASLCINEFDVKTEQLVKVKELKNGAHMIRFIRIEEPSSSHGLDIKDICMLNCCVEKNCDLAMLSEQRTNDGYKCYLFACNDSCTFAPHQDYTSMILKKDLFSDDETAVSNKQSKNNEKTSDASSSTLSNGVKSDDSPHTRSFLRESSVVLLLLIGLLFTIILLVLVGFYCRDSWKRGRVLKSRSTDADYLINGLYL